MKEKLCGFLFAGDNVDRNIRPRHRTIESQTRSVHWFTTVVIQDRCDFSELADSISVPDVSEFDLNCFLPDKDDYEQLASNVSVLVGRILIKYLSGFSRFSDLIEYHISHLYSEEMSKKSCVISHTESSAGFDIL